MTTPFRALSPDTRVHTLEERYGVNLHARSDMKLGTLLRTRGFGSWSQLLTAYRGRSVRHAKRRRVFVSFHAEDMPRVQGFRLMVSNPNVDISVYDAGLATAVQSDRGTYIRSRIKPLLARSQVLLCLIGNGTAWRDWVDWEIRTAHSLGKGICAVKLRGTRGRIPPALRDVDAVVWPWGVPQIIAAIEQAAARRS